jgi:hypothetical protein
VHGEANQIRLRVQPEAGSRLEELLAQIPEGAGLALLTEIDPIANAALVWEPGQRQIGSINPVGSDASRMASFIVFLPGLEANGGQAFEDGYAMKLTQSAWRKFPKSLRTRKPLTSFRFPDYTTTGPDH